ncbi:uncharacterized protein LOC111707105 [Eurytemora carolleeae]|uniref:uncharacterized protein LOC111707105 n=1 Tax=Eurytemora carolleeae TaxID=1294199 RepID=UPI000C77E772|nr:uncharacterized protein LOC111707105 [Eurytemora carolleeae]|eukprot:XP_023335872.1 uncharacterized protein LOC111707105 [Eurytemora affinis]
MQQVHPVSIKLSRQPRPENLEAGKRVRKDDMRMPPHSVKDLGAVSRQGQKMVELATEGLKATKNRVQQIPIINVEDFDVAGSERDQSFDISEEELKAAEKHIQFMSDISFEDHIDDLSLEHHLADNPDKELEVLKKQRQHMLEAPIENNIKNEDQTRLHIGKERISQNTGDLQIVKRQRRKITKTKSDDLEVIKRQRRKIPKTSCDNLEVIKRQQENKSNTTTGDLQIVKRQRRKITKTTSDDLEVIKRQRRKITKTSCDDLEVIKRQRKNKSNTTTGDLQIVKRQIKQITKTNNYDLETVKSWRKNISKTSCDSLEVVKQHRKNNSKTGDGFEAEERLQHQYFSQQADQGFGNRNIRSVPNTQMWQQERNFSGLNGSLQQDSVLIAEELKNWLKDSFRINMLVLLFTFIYLPIYTASLFCPYDTCEKGAPVCIFKYVLFYWAPFNMVARLLYCYLISLSIKP